MSEYGQDLSSRSSTRDLLKDRPYKNPERTAPEVLDGLILRTKLVLPRARRYLLQRPALSARLLETRHYRLTVVQASTGYGKSTALTSALQNAPFPTFWYSIAETDRDPLLFLVHLIHAFRLHGLEVGAAALDLLQETGISPGVHRAAIDALSNDLVTDGEEAILVLDDYHLVNASMEINTIVDHFLQVLPPNLHLIIATRHRPALKTLNRWRVKGELLEIDQRDLAFSDAEIEALFRTQYGLRLNPQQVQRLATETEGWVIALQMIWQSLQSGVASDLNQILAGLPRPFEDLFTYLGEEVLARQPERIQNFLLRTSILRQLEPATCDSLLGWQQGSAALLHELDEEGFFLVRLDNAYRYHHLFHDFLRRQAAADPHCVERLHRQAATLFRRKESLEEAIYHYLAANEDQTAAEMMVQASERLVREGRVDTMSEWVTALSPSVLEQFPTLMHRMGELCRFTSRFDEALAWYEQAKERYNLQRDVAGASRALRGQAAVYLDTVRPLKAESLLQEALRLVEGQPFREEEARLFELLAENMTNRGKWEEAKTLRRQAHELRQEGPDPANLDVRVLLRTGRLTQAQATLERRAAEEKKYPDRFREPRAHRETLLLLSLTYAWQGRARDAMSCARQGIEIGRRLESPFVEAVGYMRLGHAWGITEHPQAARQAMDCYRRAMDIGERLAVARTKVEALWGLCRLYGFGGDLTAAERTAHEAIEIGLTAGDEWMAALIGMMLGAGYVVAGHHTDAERWLNHSADAAVDCGDPFGKAVSLLWLSLLYHQLNSEKLLAHLQELLTLVQANDYDFLLDRQTFLGPPDPPAPVPLLVAAQQNGIETAYATRTLETKNLPADLAFHPGYTLRVSTLGSFKVQRGQAMVGDGEWHREKARSMFQLLVANRDRSLPRDEINAALWPEADADTAEGQFKVTLNALQGVLEPQRPPRAPTLFVQRRGSSYGLNPSAPLWIDAVAFEEWIAQGNKAPDEGGKLAAFQRALALYSNDFLPKCRYEDWCRHERDRLRRLYLNTAIQTAELLLARDDPVEAARLCQQMLTVDECLEPAYQLLIRAHLQRGNRVQALRAYERCESCLRQELDVTPTRETTALIEQIREPFTR